ncbi:MAG: class I SAM-dependent methyltransferase [Candidatus Thiothrix putei]|uniref:Class I SAM-dependent methyltransferase n=1 Tax=Candidatus Thiothrix putei TaxID=3080811 RepID=A0AA95HL93_9GAMM|nr:MAG: class I SAM-dependent methyltransferase [Candidatus Thiothrix putei]
MKNKNINIYEDKNTVQFYENSQELHETEKKLFDTYLNSSMSILDIGIGAGRTTRHLIKKCSCYIGIDYSQKMIESCKAQFPSLELFVVDATDLSQFKNNQFDMVIFSFNGLDYISPDTRRHQCIKEINRVLKKNGTFIFSHHYSKSIYLYPDLSTPYLSKKLWRTFRSIIKTMFIFSKTIISTAYWKESGYVHDYIHGHGGLLTYVTTPNKVKKEFSSLGFQITDVMSNLYPKTDNPNATFWYYYAARKINNDIIR